MKDRIYRRSLKFTKSKRFSTFVAQCFAVVVQTVFIIRKLAGRKYSHETTDNFEASIESIRPRAHISSLDHVRSTPDLVDASIILPAYNAEAYLRQAIESAIIQQTSYRFEIVVIDDGSTDSTTEILNEYATSEKVKVIRTTNGGVATARNIGIRSARGKYLIFLDSDDQLEPNSIELLIGTAELNDADLVQGSYDIIDTYGNTLRKVTYAPDMQEKLQEHLTSTSGYPWGKLVRRSLFEKIQFPDGMDFEDTIFSFVLFALCGRYIVVPECVYRYRANPTGITQRVTGKPSALDAYWIVPLLLEQRERLSIPVDEHLFNKVEGQFGTLLRIRLAGHEESVRRVVFYACCSLIEKLRIRIEPSSDSLTMPTMDQIFRTRRYDLWEFACKYGIA